MDPSIRIVEYFYIDAPDRPGEGARVLAELREAGVNLLAVSGFPAGRRARSTSCPRIRPRSAPPPGQRAGR